MTSLTSGLALTSGVARTAARLSRTTLLKRFASTSSSTPNTSSTSSPPTHYHVTLLRSSIGLPVQARETLSALGFGYGHWERKQSHKLHRSVLHPFSPTTAGQILRVKELVKVVNVTEEEGVDMLRKETYGRKEARGFEVVGKRVGGGKLESSTA